MSSIVNFNPVDSSAIDDVSNVIKGISLNKPEDTVESQSGVTPETNNRPEQQTHWQSEEAQALIVADTEAIKKFLEENCGLKPSFEQLKSEMLGEVNYTRQTDPRFAEWEVKYLYERYIGFLQKMFGIPLRPLATSSSGTANGGGAVARSATIRDQRNMAERSYPRRRRPRPSRATISSSSNSGLNDYITD